MPWHEKAAMPAIRRLGCHLSVSHSGITSISPSDPSEDVNLEGRHTRSSIDLFLDDPDNNLIANLRDLTAPDTAREIGVAQHTVCFQLKEEGFAGPGGNHRQILHALNDSFSQSCLLFKLLLIISHSDAQLQQVAVFVPLQLGDVDLDFLSNRQIITDSRDIGILWSERTC